MNNNWKYFKLKELFNYNRGHTLTIENKDVYKGEVPCINGSAENNGILCFLSHGITDEGFKLQPCPSLSLSRVGNSGQTFLQTKPYFIADNAFSLVLKTNQSKEVYLFLSTILNKERFKYSYGRTISIKKYLETEIKLPCIDSEPDWKYMNDFIKTLNYKPISSKNTNSIHSLNLIEWKEYKIHNLFDIKAGIYHYPEEYLKGNTPYVSASNTNNGIAQRIDKSPDFAGNCIVTGKVGCTAFYQHEDFCATSDVNILIPKNFVSNKYIGLFLVAIINKSENYKWSYGRQCRVGDSKEIIIKLPTKNNQPDWDYMENYIKNLPYGDRI